MEKLKHNIIKIYGNRGENWLAGLSLRIEQLQGTWGLSELKPLPNLSYNYVLEGFQGKTPIILKLSPDADVISKEAWALNAFKGFRAVSILGYKEGKLIEKSSGRRILLHGDLHQENILSHRNGWAVIDPKGVIGSPIHEIWACIEDPSHDLKFLSSYFDYSFQDIAEWYYVHLILAACWRAEDGLDAGQFLTLAQSVLPIIEP